MLSRRVISQPERQHAICPRSASYTLFVMGLAPLPHQEPTMSLVIPPPTRVRMDDMPSIHPNAAGMDIGARAIVVAVPPARAPEPVRVFETCTPDLHALVDWLLQCGIDTVVMASTGVYWVPASSCWSNGASSHISCTRGMSRPSRDARAIGTTPNGSRSCTPWDCCRGPCARCREVYFTHAPPASGHIDGAPGAPSPPHAKGAEAHEPPVERSAHRHHRCHRPSHPAGHRPWRA